MRKERAKRKGKDQMGHFQKRLNGSNCSCPCTYCMFEIFVFFWALFHAYCFSVTAQLSLIPVLFPTFLQNRHFDRRVL